MAAVGRAPRILLPDGCARAPRGEAARPGSAPLEKVFLLTTGLRGDRVLHQAGAHPRGCARGGARKSIFVTFDYGFHGRTMGAQLAGGLPRPEGLDRRSDHGVRAGAVPRRLPPEGHLFRRLRDQPRRAGRGSARCLRRDGETYQGCNATLMPAAYAQALRAWCDSHGALMIFDEVQAGFGRTGRCVRLPALRRRARPGGLRQGHLRRHAAVGRAGHRGS